MTPPTTPPAIAPALEEPLEELPVEAGRLEVGDCDALAELPVRHEKGDELRENMFTRTRNKFCSVYKIGESPGTRHRLSLRPRSV